jgi:DegV family protein with EDD domain
MTFWAKGGYAMNSIRIVTDSTAALPDDWLEAHNVAVVPLLVNIESEVYKEGVEISNRDFYARLRKVQELPTTSQPSSGDFLATYKRLLEEGANTIISIHISSGISGTVNSASTAAGMIEDIDADIVVIDSKQTGPALGFILKEAVALVEAGENKEEIINRVHQVMDSMRTLFVVNDLMFLHKGGRLSGAKAVIGSLLQVKPILHFVRDEGRIEVLEQVRTEKRALKRITDLMIAEGGGDRLPTNIAIPYADNREKAEEVAKLLEEEFPGIGAQPIEIGPIIGTHVGPGLIGFQFYYC